MALGRMRPAPSTLRWQSVRGTSSGFLKENVASQATRTFGCEATYKKNRWKFVNNCRYISKIGYATYGAWIIIEIVYIFLKYVHDLVLAQLLPMRDHSLTFKHECLYFGSLITHIHTLVDTLFYLEETLLPSKERRTLMNSPKQPPKPTLFKTLSPLISILIFPIRWAEPSSKYPFVFPNPPFIKHIFSFSFFFTQALIGTLPAATTTPKSTRHTANAYLDVKLGFLHCEVVFVTPGLASFLDTADGIDLHHTLLYHLLPVLAVCHRQGYLLLWIDELHMWFAVLTMSGE